MPGSTAKGVPYSLGVDPASTIDTTMQSLAEWVDGRPGIAALTTAERDVLAGSTRWEGRVIWNSTLKSSQVWNAATNTWDFLGAGGGGGLARPFLLMGA